MSLAGSPYDSANTILNTVRFRLNDRIKSLYPTSGKVLLETNASTQQAFNTGLRRFQDRISGAGVARMKTDVIISGTPVTTNMDPSSKCWISWFGFFDGSNELPGPKLPQDLRTPLWMSERWSATPGVPGNVNVFQFPPANRPNMRNMTDGLNSQPKYQYNGQWQWQDDRIYFPGSIFVMDFQIGYRKRIPDIIDVGTTPWFEQPVQIANCLDPLAWWVCAEFAAARAADGDAAETMLPVAEACEEKAVEATQLWNNEDAMRLQRTTARRRPYGGGRGRRMGGGYGY
jgi:hypothetical protein